MTSRTAEAIVGNRFRSKRLKIQTLVILLGLLIAGCNEPKLDNKYGKARKQPQSINGTSFLVRYLEELGHDITVRNRISPKINDFDIVFWFPDTTNCPIEEATEALENWMDERYAPSTLVYVNGGFTADEEYYRTIYNSATAEQKLEILRRIGETRLDRRATESAIDNGFNNRENCEWFEAERIPPKRSKQLAGPLVESIPEQNWPELEVQNLLVSKFADQDQSDRWIHSPLLTVDGEELVYSLTDSEGYSQNRIIVVNNASFLVNLPFTDPHKQAIADALISTVMQQPDDHYGWANHSEIMILESGPEGIPIRNNDYVNATQWSWIAERPLCYIVPHALAWGVLFCFVYFPIFGRPRLLEKKSTTSFRSHINAIGKQLARSKPNSFAQACKTIKQYQELISGSSSTKK